MRICSFYYVTQCVCEHPISHFSKLFHNVELLLIFRKIKIWVKIALSTCYMFVDFLGFKFKKDLVLFCLNSVLPLEIKTGLLYKYSESEFFITKTIQIGYTHKKYSLSVSVKRVKRFYLESFHRYNRDWYNAEYNRWKGSIYEGNAIGFLALDVDSTIIANL